MLCIRIMNKIFLLFILFQEHLQAAMDNLSVQNVVQDTTVVLAQRHSVALASSVQQGRRSAPHVPRGTNVLETLK